MRNESPICQIDEQEMLCLFSGFCTYVALTAGKKLNTANVFLKFLKNKHLRNIFKLKFSVESDYEAVQLFLKHDPSIYKSKYIMKYLNNTCKNEILQ